MERSMGGAMEELAQLTLHSVPTAPPAAGHTRVKSMDRNVTAVVEESHFM